MQPGKAGSAVFWVSETHSGWFFGRSKKEIDET
jgi:hypothetical protein